MGSVQKPDKPRPDYPLFLHQTGRFAKKIHGKLRYFGRWGNKRGSEIVVVDDLNKACEEAEERYLDSVYPPPEKRTVVGNYLESKKKTLELKHLAVRELHSLGYSDVQIAAMMKCSTTPIRAIRKKFGLNSNGANIAKENSEISRRSLQESMSCVETLFSESK